MRRLAQRGLTLVEVLAAVVLLSAVAGACISILRDASGAASSIPLDEEARQALNVWSLQLREASEDEAPVVPWTWTAPSGNEWSEAHTDPATDLPTAANTDPAPGTLQLLWSPIVLTCSAAPDQAWTFWRLDAPVEGQSP